MAALAIVALAIIVGSWPFVVAAIGNGTLVAVALITAWALLAGHMLGGPDEGNRGALAVACAARHPGVAMGLATMSLAGEAKPIVGAVLLTLAAGIVFTVPYVRWRKKAVA
jgi:BASS family bile acid:Na+ symporter